MRQTRVSVVMSVYNGERHLREAVESILSQSFTDFEFIIVDDGSTDGTWDILSGYNDPRIVLLRNEQNIGLTRSLNRGLAVARGGYIARMDADDVSLPERLAIQVAFLDEHPDVGLVGSPPFVIDAQGNTRPGWLVPLDDVEIKWRLLFNNAFVHSSVMFRRSVLDIVGPYSVDKVAAQDYGLWVRIACNFAVANIAQPLIYRRDHPIAISHSRAETQAAHALEVSVAYLSALLGDSTPPRPLVEQLRHLGTARFASVDPAIAAQVVETLWQVYRVFAVRHQLDRQDRQKAKLEIRRWIRERIVGLAGYWGEHGCPTLCWRLLRDLLRIEPRAAVTPSTYRALARSMLGQGAMGWIRLGLRRFSTRRQGGYGS